MKNAKRLLYLFFGDLMGILCLLAACTSSGRDAPKTLTAFAASSLTDAFTEIGQAFERDQRGVRVAFNFAASSQLRAQLQEGAQADLFASADLQEMDAARAANLLQGDTHTFARNRLVVVMPKDNPGQIAALADLARPNLRLVLAQAQVPVGQYSRRMLEKVSQDTTYGPDFARLVLDNVVSEEDNVRQTLAKVQLGEADAGIVYATDVTEKARASVITLGIPDAFNQVAEYPLAVLRESHEPSLARAFLEYIQSSAGQAILRKYGFLPASP